MTTSTPFIIDGIIDSLAQLLSDLENGLDYYHDEKDSCSRLRTLCAEAELAQEGCGAMVIWRNSRMMEDDMLKLSIEMLIDRLTPRHSHPRKVLHKLIYQLDECQTMENDHAITAAKECKYAKAAEHDARSHGVWMAKQAVHVALNEYSL